MPSANDLIPLEEINALIAYAARVDKRSDLLASVIRELGDKCQAYCDSQNAAPSSGSYPQQVSLLMSYNKLCALTHPINGKTLLDSGQVTNLLKIPITVFWLCFALVIFHTGLNAFYDNIADPKGSLLALSHIKHYLLDILSPFLWGALGAFTFMIKQASDLSSERQFDYDAFHGMATRIGLGAILGGSLQFLYDDKVFSTNGLNLDANAIGYLTGIGTKVVYGSLEKIVETLAQHLNLGEVKQQQDERAAIQRFLFEQMNAANTAIEQLQATLDPDNPDGVAVQQIAEIKQKQNAISQLMKNA